MNARWPPRRRDAGGETLPGGETAPRPIPPADAARRTEMSGGGEGVEGAGQTAGQSPEPVKKATVMASLETGDDALAGSS